MQTKREQLADLAMAIFMRDPPSDPKTLYETQQHSTIKLSGLGTASKGKASKHEVCYRRMLQQIQTVQQTCLVELHLWMSALSEKW